MDLEGIGIGSKEHIILYCLRTGSNCGPLCTE